jgi:hypothetical protein
VDDGLRGSTPLKTGELLLGPIARNIEGRGIMDRELPAKIWIPALAACALIPAVILFGDVRRAFSGTIVLATLGLTVYLIVFLIKRAKRDRSFTDKFVTVAYAFGTFIVLMVGMTISDATKPPPTPEELVAQAKAEQPREMTEKEQNDALNRMFPEMQGNIDRAWREIELQKKLGVEGYERHQDDALRDDAYDRMMRNR